MSSNQLRDELDKPQVSDGKTRCTGIPGCMLTQLFGLHPLRLKLLSNSIVKSLRVEDDFVLPLSQEEEQ